MISTSKRNGGKHNFCLLLKAFCRKYGHFQPVCLLSVPPARASALRKTSGQGKGNSLNLTRTESVDDDSHIPARHDHWLSAHGRLQQWSLTQACTLVCFRRRARYRVCENKNLGFSVTHEVSSTAHTSGGQHWSTVCPLWRQPCTHEPILDTANAPFTAQRTICFGRAQHTSSVLDCPFTRFRSGCRSRNRTLGILAVGSAGFPGGIAATGDESGCRQNHPQRSHIAETH